MTVGTRHPAAPAPERRGASRAEGDDGRNRDPWGRLSLVCVVLAILPVVVATVRAIATDWIPIGDNAFFTIRARDVLTEHHPWLGTWTSASLTIGEHVNNPGPLFWDVLAVPAKIDGHGGLAVGVALVNIAAIVGTAVVARRAAGGRGVVVAMAAATGLAWTMGSELLFEPWQPHSLLLPFFCFLVMVWAVAGGDSAVLPWTVAVASLIVQTHIGYAVIVPALGGWAVLLLALGLRDATSARGQVAVARRRALRHGALALVVGLVAWAQPLWEQLFGSGRGNLGRLVDGVGETGESLGWARAPRFVADVVALPPWWGRGSMGQQFGFLETTPVPGVTASLLGLAAVVGVLVLALAVARRRADRVAAVAVATALFALGASVVAATTIPTGVFGVAAHHLRWLWPLAVFVTFAAALGLLTAPRPTRLTRAGVGALAVGTLVLAMWNLPTMNSGVGPSADVGSMDTVRDLLPQLAALRDEPGVLVEAEGLRFAEPFSTTVMMELQDIGVPFFVDDAGLVRQLGDSRSHDGTASVRLHLREGDAARREMVGARRVAFVEGLDDAERRELRDLIEQLEPFIASGGIVLNERGEDARTSRDATARARVSVDLDDPTAVFFTRALVGLVRSDMLDLDPEWRDRVERYAELQFRSDRYTVAVFAEPLDGGAAS